MENTHTKRLVIGNFKSIKYLDIDCKKVNVFIGKPNVGKSNILEGISLLGATYSRDRDKFLHDLIRYENFYNLLYDNDPDEYVYIVSDTNLSFIKYAITRDSYRFMTLGKTQFYDDAIRSFPFSEEAKKRMRTTRDYIYNWLDVVFEEESMKKWYDESLSEIIKTFFDKRLSEPFWQYGEGWFWGNSYVGSKGTTDFFNQIGFTNNSISIFKKYDFSKGIKIENKDFVNFLMPPHGENLFVTLRRFKELNKEAVDIFQEYGLNLVFKERDKLFEIQKNIEGIITEYPYSSMADTLQRIIFYLLAIETNKNSVLIFEEPEAHSFPPYTKLLAERIAENESNQFFITTHSPYLLQTLIENVVAENLNIFVTYYEDYQTKVRKISEEEFRDIDAMDIFFNLDKVNA